MAEIWLPAVGFEGRYEVSDQGRVRSIPKVDSIGRRVPPKVLTNARESGRYLRIRLRDEHGDRERVVHQMVLEAFVGPRPPGMEACHNDGDRSNNRLANLRWDTSSANQLDKVAHGTVVRGERQKAARLTAARAAAVKALAAAGVSSDMLSAAFGISRHSVDAIRRGVTWSWVAPTSGLPDALAPEMRAAATERHRARHAVAVAGAARSRSAQARAARAELEYARLLGVAITFADQRADQQQEATR